MKICECGCSKETHFLKDGACYGFTLVDGEVMKCPCTKFKKRSRKHNNIKPVEPIKEIVSSAITQEEFEEWAKELKEEIHIYLTNKGSFKIIELENIIDKKVRVALE